MNLSKREREALARLPFLIPATTSSLQARLEPTVAAASACGWTVNFALETGGDFERVTFSASRPRAISAPPLQRIAGRDPAVRSDASEKGPGNT